MKKGTKEGGGGGADTISVWNMRNYIFYLLNI